MKPLAVLAVIFLLACNTAFSQTPSNAHIKEQALAIPLGFPVEVRLLSHETLRGRMGQVSEQGFVLQYVKADQVQEQTLAFTEVKSVGRYLYYPRHRRFFLLIPLAAVAASTALMATHHR